MAQYNNAASRFNLGGGDWQKPKPRQLFYIEITGANIPDRLTSRIGKLVKTSDRPSIQYEVIKKNQYNKTRLVNKNITYTPVTMYFHDTADSPILNLMHLYNQFYFGDFQNKAPEQWQYDLLSGAEGFDDLDWGVSTARTGIGEDSYFFDQITIYEFYGSRYDYFTIVHPKISAFNMDARDINGALPSEIWLTFEYEGYTFENALPVTLALADKVGLRFTSGIPGLDIVGDLLANQDLKEIRDLARDLGLGDIIGETLETIPVEIFDILGRGRVATDTVNYPERNRDGSVRIGSVINQGRRVLGI